jgi:hypothetical protein
MLWVENKEVITMPQVRRYHSSAERQAAYRERQVQARREQLQQKGLPLLPALPTVPGHARWRALLERGQWALEQMVEEMDAYAADRSPQWQDSERGEEFIEHLEAAREQCTNLQDLGPVNK